ncbi:MAG: hypothetical protein RI885_2306, partial [Actinomycetota bacterium]
PGFYLGANGVWTDSQETMPSDFELGGNVSVSLQHRLSVVGCSYYGLQQEYLRASAGGRYTVTDVDNNDFSIGVGLQYHVSSDEALRPKEWAADVTIGFAPVPKDMPALTVILQGSHGLTTETTAAYVGGRFTLGGAR